MQKRFAKERAQRRARTLMVSLACVWGLGALGLAWIGRDASLFSAPEQIANALLARSRALENACILLFTLSTCLALFCFFMILAWSKAQDGIADVATKDDLTGALLLQAFFEEAERAKRLAERSAKPLSSICFEIGNLMELNKEMGREAGDRLLRAAGIAANATLRDTDCLGRVTGLRFVAILPGADEGKAAIARQRLQTALEDVRHSSTKGELRLSVRMGAATWRVGSSAEDLVNDALIAMEKEKFTFDLTA